MAEGTVKWFDDNKGYGFVEPEDGGEDAFVHHSDIQMEGYATLSEGQKVSFELTQTEKGPKALEVVPLEEPGGEESGGASGGASETPSYGTGF